MFPIIAAASRRRGVRLIGPQYLSPLLTLARSHGVGVSATSLAANGTTLEDHAANVARYNGAGRRLLIEGARVNSLTASSAPATQSPTLAVTTYTLSVVGGSATIAAGTAVGTGWGTATPGAPVVVTVTTGGTATVTPSGAARFQLENGPHASSNIVRTSTSGARNADLVAATWGSIFSGAGALVGRVALQATAPATGGSGVIFGGDDGAATNYMRVLNPNGTANIIAGRAAASATGFSATAGTVTPGADLRIGMSWDGAGRLAVCVNGGTVQAVLGAPTAGLTTLRVGNSHTGAGAAFGEYAALDAYARLVPDDELVALVAGIG